MKTLSVIIPCYNAEKTVGRLIKSFGSGLPWVKLIFIDDCSQDDTVSTIEKYAQERGFDFSILVNEVNSGVSFSRNRGLAVAQSEFVLFADSDDYFAPDAFEKINKALKKEADVYFFDTLFALGKLKRTLKGCAGAADGGIKPQDAILSMNYAVWSKVYKLRIIKKNKILFPPMKIKEDFVFNVTAILHCSKILYIADYYYVYVNNSSSAMNTTPMSEDIQRTAFKVLREQIPENGLPLLPMLALKDFLYEGAKNAALASDGTERIQGVVSEFEKEFASLSVNLSQLHYGLYYKATIALLLSHSFQLFRLCVRMRDILRRMASG